MGLLKFESQWLLMLITIQLFKVIFFSLWQIKLINKEFNEEDEERISTIRSDGRPTADLAILPLSARQHIGPNIFY